MKILEKINDYLNEETYEEFFTKKLKEAGVSSPAELDDDKKKNFST
jgi:hypothetical protein